MGRGEASVGPVGRHPLPAGSPGSPIRRSEVPPYPRHGRVRGVGQGHAGTGLHPSSGRSYGDSAPKLCSFVSGCCWVLFLEGLVEISPCSIAEAPLPKIQIKGRCGSLPVIKAYDFLLSCKLLLQCLL